MSIVLRGFAAILGAGLAAVPAVAAGAVQDPVSCPPGAVGLANSSFEAPAGKGPRFLAEGEVPGWSTTASDKRVELWGPGNGFANRGNEVPAADGAQFAELNATRPSTLYQDVATTPGQKLLWRIRHRARDVSPGVDKDTMHVLIGAPGAESPQKPSGAATPDIVDTDAAWGTWTGVYTVPAGQTTTRFGFKAVSTASGNDSMGNFLDDITFGTPACVIATKSADADGPLAAGDELAYTVRVRNDGGSAAGNPVVRDAIPAGATYVPGSITLDGVPLTDAADGDAAEFADGTVVARPDRLERGDAAELGFRVTVTEGAKGRLENTATAHYVSVLIGEDGTATSNTVVTPLVAGVEPTPTTSSPSPTASSPSPSTSGSREDLATTGAALGVPAAIGAALLAAGGALVLLARRARRS
ncbi:hypothetical protein Afil01_50250 [Actinorhabdospora filicis]|uniref:Gram-positive cocci surface proteins LPxTG domain-containing protein n=1 Tax=Actinorhabdospora filicis TaxID=1785913 RepID=A0A9W6SQE8_9ACTN|nr:DUF11 domain-containing protein [Actinorhabdospora filicis]GLZ80218.1 hypothetical protein Afil01_50250 [Actinorhabdospora filicis]